MPIALSWDDETTKQIIRWDFTDRWTMDELWVSADALIALMRTSPNKVTIIIDATNNKRVAAQPLKTSRLFLEKVQAEPNFADFLSIVRADPFGRALFFIFRRMVNWDRVDFVGSVEEARRIALQRLGS